MRVRLTVTATYRITPVLRSVAREAGANPARTRHCHRGSPPHAIGEIAGHWHRSAELGRRGEGQARKPGDLLPAERPNALVERGGSVKLHRLAGLLAGLCCLLVSPSAQAAPVTVNLRIEGPTRTLFEDPVTVDVRTFHLTGDPASHVCDGTAANQGPSATPVPTRGGAVAQAIDAGLVAHGSWSDGFGSPSFSDIGGESVAYDGSKFLGEYKNEAFS